MPYQQERAFRTQTTIINVIPGAWTALEPTVARPGVNNTGTSVTTPLDKRFAIKVFNVGTAGASRVGLSFNTVHNIKQSHHWLGVGQFVVEPCSTGLTLYGRAKVAASINSVRLVVVEYGG